MTAAATIKPPGLDAVIEGILAEWKKPCMREVR
jgi:hypothetical protein